MKSPRTTRAARALFAALLLPAVLPLCAPRAVRAQQPPLLLQGPTRGEAQTAPTPTPRPAPPPAAPKAAAPPAADAAKESRPATPPLTGRVVGEAGEPILGVAVYAVSRGSVLAFRSPHTSITDDGGNFRLQGLAPGLYMLTANIPGYVSELDPVTGRPGSIHRPGDNATVRLMRGGVITGVVTGQQGEPLIALSVRALRVRDIEGRPPHSPFPFAGEDSTDDRGVYRIYGLLPGTYVVFVSGAASSVMGLVAAYGDVSTFYPSGTRDTAAEIAVRGGQEAAGIDIRYREERGHRVTGTLDFPAGTQMGEGGASITLSFASTGMVAGHSGIGLNTPERAFSIEGVSDGDYDLQAQSGGREGLTMASAPQRVSVRSADVTGVRVTLRPLASASGTLRIEPLAADAAAREACKSVRPSQLPQETLVTVTPEHTRPTAGRPFSRLATLHDATPDETGAFVIRPLEPGRYRLSVRLFDEALYVRSVQLPGVAPPPGPAPAAAAAPATAAAARDLLELKPGQQLNGLSVRLAEGAASVSGRVAPGEGATPQTPAPTRVYLVPQERERAEDPLRFHEAVLTADGSFSFKNLAPGRYRVLARAVADAVGDAPRPAAPDADARAALRREAEAGGTPLELQPCQRTTDFVLSLPPAK